MMTSDFPAPHRNAQPGIASNASSVCDGGNFVNDEHAKAGTSAWRLICGMIKTGSVIFRQRPNTFQLTAFGANPWRPVARSQNPYAVLPQL